MRLSLDFDPLKGVHEYLEFSHDGDKKVMHIVQEQDVTPILEQAKSLAKDEDYTKQGIKQDQWHYARIPDVVLLEMERKHKVKWNDKNDEGHKRFFSVLNAHYPAFKTTSWNHE